MRLNAQATNSFVSESIRVMRVISRMNLGGPAIQITSLMRGLDSNMFEHRLYTGFCDKHEIDYLDLIQTESQVFRINGLGRRIDAFADIRALLCLIRDIRRFKPHVIHTHTAKAGVLGRLASIMSLHPSIRIHTFHGHLLTGYFSRWKLSLVIVIERILARHTNYLLAVGEKVRQDLLDVKIGREEQFGVMPPGLEVRELREKSTSKSILDLNTDKLQCAFIGRVTKIKRPDRLLDLALELKRRNVNLQFFIAGDGELLDYCRERIYQEDLPIKVLGWQSNIELILSAADLVVLTSDNEGTPLSLIQAGMAGLPVVTTNVGSVSEVVIHGQTGFVTSPNISELADYVTELVKDADVRTKLGKAAQDFTLTHFGVSRLVKNHEELYRKLLINQAKS